MPYASDTAYALWQPPARNRLPDVRRSLIAHHRSPEAMQMHGMAIRSGTTSTLIPNTATPFQAASVMNRQEADRLSHGRLYYLGPDLTTVVNNRASRPKKQPLNPRRIPGWDKGHRSGFVIFAHPIGSYERTNQLGQTLHTPIVAASWGPWYADFAPDTDAQPHDGFDAPYWRVRGAGDDGLMLIGEEDTGRRDDEDAEPRWVWMTFYSMAGASAAQMAGQAGQSVKTSGPLLLWDQETAVKFGAEFDAPPEPGTTDVYMRAVVAAWDLLTQNKVTGKPFTVTTEIEQKPTKQRADRRRGITDDGTVTVIDLFHTPRQVRRTTSAGQEAKNTSADGEHEYVWTERREVDSYPRNHCMNPRLHAEDPDLERHEHEDIEVIGYIAGPPGAPIRSRENTVYYANKVPEGADAS